MRLECQKLQHLHWVCLGGSHCQASFSSNFHSCSSHHLKGLLPLLPKATKQNKSGPRTGHCEPFGATWETLVKITLAFCKMRNNEMASKSPLTLAFFKSMISKKLPPQSQGMGQGGLKWLRTSQSNLQTQSQPTGVGWGCDDQDFSLHPQPESGGPCRPQFSGPFPNS